jgi:nitrous oxidase accessory protein NosD
MKRRVAVMLGVALAAVGLSMGPTRAAGVLVVDDDFPRSCAARAADHATIQAAVDEAGPRDRIRVCPGTYKETVTVPVGKRGLTIEGAKAGIDARRRSPTGHGESIVTADSAGGVVRLLADKVVWDGFRIFDNTEGPGMYTSPDASGYVIRNTVFVDNGLGLYLNTSGKAPNKVRHNRFTANNEFEDRPPATASTPTRGRAAS